MDLHPITAPRAGQSRRANAVPPWWAAAAHDGHPLRWPFRRGTLIKRGRALLTPARGRARCFGV